MITEELTLKNITYIMHGTKIIDTFSCDLFNGEILGLVGLADAGQRTIAEIISGDIRNYSGTILVRGKERKIRSIADAQKLGIYCVRNDTQLIPALSIIENICVTYPGIQNGCNFPSPILKKMTAVIIKEFGLELDLGKKVSDLSYYETKLVKICRAYLCNAKILVMINIFQNCTDEEKKTLVKLIRYLIDTGISIMLIDDDIAALCELCARITALSNGRKIGTYYKGDFSYQFLNLALTGSKYNNSSYLKHQYGERVRLRLENIMPDENGAINIEVREGEVYGLCFANRTALCAFRVKLREGICAADGRILVDGADIGENRFVLQKNVSYISKYKQMMFPKLSIMNNLGMQVLTKYFAGIDLHEKFVNNIWEEYAGQRGIDSSIRMTDIVKTNNIQQLKAVLYRALLNNPAVIVLDNVFYGTDPVLRNVILDFIMEAKIRKIAILLISPLSDGFVEVIDNFTVV